MAHHVHPAGLFTNNLKTQRLPLFINIPIIHSFIFQSKLTPITPSCQWIGQVFIAPFFKWADQELTDVREEHQHECRSLYRGGKAQISLPGTSVWLLSQAGKS